MESSIIFPLHIRNIEVISRDMGFCIKSSMVLLENQYVEGKSDCFSPE